MSDFLPRVACQINLVGGYTVVKSYPGDDEALEQLLASTTQDALRSKSFQHAVVATDFGTVCSASCNYAAKAKDDLGRSGIITGFAIRATKGRDLETAAIEVLLSELGELRADCLKNDVPFEISVLAVKAILLRLALSAFEAAEIPPARPPVEREFNKTKPANPVSGRKTGELTEKVAGHRIIQTVFNWVMVTLIIVLLVKVFFFGGG
jgi:hypothetical protein